MKQRRKPHRRPPQTKRQMELGQIAGQFLTRNYDYIWLRTMLDKGANISRRGATLITGPSYGTYGIDESQWNNAVNCSVDSQDLYYDFLCAKRVLLSAEGGQNAFDRCFIILGYFSAYSDLSLSVNERERMIAPVFYPIFDDAHNWETPHKQDPWTGFGDLPEQVRSICENAAASEILKHNNYFKLRKRQPFFNLQGRSWSEVSTDEKLAMGNYRAQNHSKVRSTSLAENKQILKEYVHFLHQKNVLPVAVIPPFSSAYNQFISREIKESVLELVDSVPEDIHYVDFNESGHFNDSCFMDTDHLSAQGAYMMCSILAEMFGR